MNDSDANVLRHFDIASAYLRQIQCPTRMTFPCGQAEAVWHRSTAPEGHCCQ